MGAKRVVFLDKDGTLIPDIPFNVNPQLISISENATEGLRKLQGQGYEFIVISNQSGIAAGKFGHDAVLELSVALKALLQVHGIKLTDFYYCPHSVSQLPFFPGLSCACRKPKPGMLLNAAREHQIDLSSSWMIGDILDDVQAGNIAGCKTILIDNGNETEWKVNWKRTPDMIVPTIDAAAEFIISNNE